MDMGLAGKTALVMGGSSGLGLAIASALAGKGVRVALCARDQARLDAARTTSGAAEAVVADFSQPGSTAGAVRAAMAALGSLDILVTNCGGPHQGEFLSIDEAAWREAFQQVWLSAVEAVRVALPPMVERGWGRILMVTSSTAREPLPGLTLSNALRPGLAGLANSLSREVASRGVTVNVLVPGTMETDRLADLGTSRDNLVAKIPAGRIGKPGELGALAVFLASEHAAYITGESVACDGGRLRSI